MSLPNLRTVLTLCCGAALLTACPGDDSPPEATSEGDDTTGTTTNSTVTVNPTATVTVTDSETDTTPATDSSTTFTDPDTTAGPDTDTDAATGSTTVVGETDPATDSTTAGETDSDTDPTGGMVFPCVDAANNLGNALPVAVMTTNVGAGDDFMASCAFMGGNDEDVTFQWTAPMDGDYAIDTFGSPIDTILTVVSDCMGTEVDCNDDAGGGLQSEIIISLMAGDTILITVDGWNETGDFNLNINEVGGGMTTGMTGSTTGMTGGSGSSTGIMPGMGFGDCATMDPMVACTADELCLVDSADPAMQTIGICTFFGCAVDADCPAAPPGGAAPVICTDLNGDMVAEECAIDCSGGDACPTGMTCFAGFVCAWPV